MANFCKECTHWECVVKDSNSKGICKNTGVALNVGLDIDKVVITGATLWTAPYFGCIYWEEDDGTLLDFDDIIDEDGKPKEDDDD